MTACSRREIYSSSGLDPDLLRHWNKGLGVFQILAHRLIPQTACNFRLQSRGVTSFHVFWDCTNLGCTHEIRAFSDCKNAV
jgi:hypothetical protein